MPLFPTNIALLLDKLFVGFVELAENYTNQCAAKDGIVANLDMDDLSRAIGTFYNIVKEIKKNVDYDKLWVDYPAFLLPPDATPEGSIIKRVAPLTDSTSPPGAGGHGAGRGSSPGRGDGNAGRGGGRGAGRGGGVNTWGTGAGFGVGSFGDTSVSRRNTLAFAGAHAFGEFSIRGWSISCQLGFGLPLPSISCCLDRRQPNLHVSHDGVQGLDHSKGS